MTFVSYDLKLKLIDWAHLLLENGGKFRLRSENQIHIENNRHRTQEQPVVALDLTGRYRWEKIQKRERKLPKKFKEEDRIQSTQIILVIFNEKIFSIENEQKRTRVRPIRVDIQKQIHPTGHSRTRDLSKRPRPPSKRSSTRTRSISGLFLIHRLLVVGKTRKKKSQKRRFSRILQLVDFWEKRNRKKIKMIIQKQLLL